MILKGGVESVTETEAAGILWDYITKLEEPPDWWPDQMLRLIKGERRVLLGQNKDLEWEVHRLNPLVELAKRSSLMRVGQTLQFFHQSWRDYIAGEALYDQGYGTARTLTLEHGHVAWSEPIVFLAGLLKNLSPLVRDILQGKSGRAAGPSLMLALRCLRNAGVKRRTDFQIWLERLHEVLRSEDSHLRIVGHAEEVLACEDQLLQYADTGAMRANVQLVLGEAYNAAGSTGANWTTIKKYFMEAYLLLWDVKDLPGLHGFLRQVRLTYIAKGESKSLYERGLEVRELCRKANQRRLEGKVLLDVLVFVLSEEQSGRSDESLSEALQFCQESLNCWNSKDLDN